MSHFSAILQKSHPADALPSEMNDPSEAVDFSTYKYVGFNIPCPKHVVFCGNSAIFYPPMTSLYCCIESGSSSGGVGGGELEYSVGKQNNVFGVRCNADVGRGIADAV